MSWVMYSFKLDKQSECFAINKTHCMLDFYRLLLFFFNKINSFGKQSLYRIGIFLGLLKFQLFFGVVEIPDSFGDEG